MRNNTVVFRVVLSNRAFEIKFPFYADPVESRRAVLRAIQPSNFDNGFVSLYIKGKFECRYTLDEFLDLVARS